MEDQLKSYTGKWSSLPSDKYERKCKEHLFCIFLSFFTTYYIILINVLCVHTGDGLGWWNIFSDYLSIHPPICFLILFSTQHLVDTHARAHTHTYTSLIFEGFNGKTNNNFCCYILLAMKSCILVSYFFFHKKSIISCLHCRVSTSLQDLKILLNIGIFHGTVSKLEIPVLGQHSGTLEGNVHLDSG